MSRAAPLVLAVGELLVDFIQDPAEPDRFRRAAGGAPANAAAQVARLGGNSAFIGRVGDDPHGHWLKETLAGTGVDTTGVALDGEAPTTLAFVTLQPGGERAFSFHRNGTADTRLAAADLLPGLFRAAGVVHFCSISLTREPARSTTMQALKLAREAGALVSFDVNWREALWDDPAEGLQLVRAALGLADLVKASDEELRLLGFADAAEILTLGPRLAVVSLGAGGVQAATPDFSLAVPGFTVPSIDTTGAGDSLAGALLHSLSPNPGLAEDPGQLRGALTRACAAAALSTTRHGAIPSYPNSEQLARFLAQA